MARLTIPKRHHIIQQYCYTLFYTARITLPKRHGVIRSPAEDEAHNKNRSKLEKNHQDFFCTVLILDGTFSVILSVIVTPFQVVFVILSTTSSSC